MFETVVFNGNLKRFLRPRPFSHLSLIQRTYHVKDPEALLLGIATKNIDPLITTLWYRMSEARLILEQHVIQRRSIFLHPLYQVACIGPWSKGG